MDFTCIIVPLNLNKLSTPLLIFMEDFSLSLHNLFKEGRFSEVIQLSKSHSISPENLIVEFQIDESIIGGLVAKVGDRIYDGSIRSQLKEIQNVLK